MLPVYSHRLHDRLTNVSPTRRIHSLFPRPTSPVVDWIMQSSPETTRRWVIRCVDLAGITVNGKTVPEGAYLREYDPNAYNGRGSATWTRNRERAIMFDSRREAYEFWRQPSTRMPMRPDGLTNRPLTAFTVEIEGIDG